MISEEVRRIFAHLLGEEKTAMPVPEKIERPSPISAKEAATRRPGALRGSAVITVKTRQAQVLLAGREPTPDRNYGVMGLFQLGMSLKNIGVAAKQGDPWAEWYLVQMEEKLKETELSLIGMQNDIMAILDERPVDDIDVEPLQVSLDFMASHSYWVVRLISEYDKLVCMILTAKRAALLNSKNVGKCLRKAGRQVRELFGVTISYRRTGVARSDVLDGTELARRAEQQMGKLPQEILNRSVRVQFMSTADEDFDLA